MGVVTSQTWANDAGGGTPLNATRLNLIQSDLEALDALLGDGPEDVYADVAARLDAIATSITSLTANQTYGTHVVTWNGSGWRYRGTTVTARPSTAAFTDGGFVIWNTSQHSAVTTAPSLAVDGDVWIPHADVTPA